MVGIVIRRSSGRWIRAWAGGCLQILSHQVFCISPYALMFNNPIMNIDPLGGSSARYDIDGEFVEWRDVEVKGITGETETITDPITGGRSYVPFYFNDINEDVEKYDRLKIGPGVKIIVLGQAEIRQSMVASGVYPDEPSESNFEFIYRESHPVRTKTMYGVSEGKLDHVGYQNAARKGGGARILHMDNFHLVMDLPNPDMTLVSYNAKDSGNFLWGLSGGLLGFSLQTLQRAAHINNAMNGAQQNQKDVGFLDDPADQRAIHLGYYYSIDVPEN